MAMAQAFWRRSLPVGKGANSARLMFFKPPTLLQAATAALCSAEVESLLYCTANWSRLGLPLNANEVPLFWWMATG